MFFILSKIVGVFLEPLLHPFLLLGVAVISKWRKRKRLARFCYGLAICLPLVYGFLPLTNFALQHLESQFPVPDLAQMEGVEGIIVLGGHTGDSQISESRNQPQQKQSAERLTYGLALHRRFPDAILLFTGFSGQLRPQGWDEAKTTTALLDALGVSHKNILFERASRNTYENAVRSHAVLVPQPGARWLLVTSANHMPRAVGAFRKVGWTGVIPYPVDYRTPMTTTKYFSLRDGFDTMRTSLHEYVGLLVYWLTGRTDAVIPGPLRNP